MDDQTQMNPQPVNPTVGNENQQVNPVADPMQAPAQMPQDQNVPQAPVEPTVETPAPVSNPDSMGGTNPMQDPTQAPAPSTEEPTMPGGQTGSM